VLALYPLLSFFRLRRQAPNKVISSSYVSRMGFFPAPPFFLAVNSRAALAETLRRAAARNLRPPRPAKVLSSLLMTQTRASHSLPDGLFFI